MRTRTSPQRLPSRLAPRAAPLAVALGAGLLVVAAAALHPLLWLPLIFVLVPAAEFVLTPLWTRHGVYRYYSPLLFVLARGERLYELHGGTLYDHLFHGPAAVRGRAARRARLRCYLAGLLGLIDDIERGVLAPDARLTGTSYFFGERSARRLGFTVERAGRSERLHLALNALGLALIYRGARGRWALPPVWRARRATTTAAQLARRRAVVEAWLERLSDADGATSRARAARAAGRAPRPG